MSTSHRTVIPKCTRTLLTPADIAQLLENGRRRDRDHAPVCKLFFPASAATWLLSELEPDAPQIAFALNDLGFGIAELGSVSLEELSQPFSVPVRIRKIQPDGEPIIHHGRVPMHVERDAHFSTRWPMSVWARAASAAGAIVESGPIWNEAVEIYRLRHPEEARAIDTLIERERRTAPDTPTALVAAA